MKLKYILTALAAGCMLLGSAQAAEPAVPVAEITAALSQEGGAVFPIGRYNAANVNNFTGDSYVAFLTDKGVPVFNVTFAKGAHTYWHIHHDTCQMLFAVSGSGYYQIWGQEPKKLRPGDNVTIPANTKHWHGAAPGAYFQHLGMYEPGSHRTEWLEPVDEALFASLK